MKYTNDSNVSDEFINFWHFLFEFWRATRTQTVFHGPLGVWAELLEPQQSEILEMTPNKEFKPK